MHRVDVKVNKTSQPLNDEVLKTEVRRQKQNLIIFKWNVKFRLDILLGRALFLIVILPTKMKSNVLWKTPEGYKSLKNCMGVIINFRQLRKI